MFDHTLIKINHNKASFCGFDLQYNIFRKMLLFQNQYIYFVSEEIWTKYFTIY